MRLGGQRPFIALRASITLNFHYICSLQKKVPSTALNLYLNYMKKTIIAISAAILCFGCGENRSMHGNHASYTDYVDPFIGTGGIVHTYPGATVPFGMIQLSPDTDITGWNWCSGYHDSDSTIKGFSHTHLSGTGWADLGDILLTATTGPIQMMPGAKDRPDDGYRSRISHSPDNEKASVGYYMVNLLDYGVKAEMTTTDRVGFHRYTFPASEQSNIIIDPVSKIFGETRETSVQIINDKTIEGHCHSWGWGGLRNVFFVAEFSKPFTSAGVSLGDVPTQDKTAKGPDAKAYATFNTTANESIVVRVSISAVSQEGARGNMKSVAQNKTFEQVHAAAVKLWEKELSNFEFDGVDDTQMRILYTGLYHAMIQPNLWMDTDGGFSASEKLWNSKDFKNYSTFSFWDTFRAVHPLLTITNHDITREVVNTLISRHENGGHVPLWELCGYDNACMIGYGGVSIMADAILKGVKGIDEEKAYAAMRHIAFYPNHSSSDGESGLPQYIEQGYVPAGVDGSVSKTMEYSYYDWCISLIADRLGKKEDAEMFRKRAMNFMNHWNAEKGYMWPKDSMGNWIEGLDLTDWSTLMPHYISGGIWGYTYFYPQATSYMVDVMGGPEAFGASMDKVLNTPMNMKGEQHVDMSGFIGHYGHGDEPGHHFLYLYNYAGEAWKIADRLHEVSDTYYSDRRDGMPNNDDCGQMSAWYIFSAMGFYPVSPGDLTYVIGAPMMNGAKIKTASGKEFTMKAHNYSNKNIYVESAKLNGKPLERGYITHDEITSGSTLEFFMSDTPNKELFKDSPAVSAIHNQK